MGVLAEVGRGKLTEKDVESFLVKQSDIPAKLTAPPSGLFFEKVYYQGEAREKELKPVMGI